MKFLRHWQALSDEQRKKAIPDERLLRVALQEVSFIQTPEVKILISDSEKQNASSIEHVNELIKLKARVLQEGKPEEYEALALKALKEDSERHYKVY